MRNETRAETTSRQTPQPLPFSVALGHRLRRVREDAGNTAADVAAHARLVGLSWDRSTVARIELGQRQVSAAELLLLSLIYGTAVADLLPTEPVRLSNLTSAEPEALRDCLTAPAGLPGFQVDGLLDLVHQGLEQMRFALKAAEERLPGRAPGISILRAAGHVGDETTVKAARKLGATAEEIATAAQMLWSRSLAAERDARVEALGPTTPRARQARRGHATRTLLAELEPAVERVRTKDEED